MLLFTLVACSDDKKPHELPFEVRFACPEDGDRADQLTLRVMGEGCEERELLDGQMLANGNKAEAFSGVPAGNYGLAVTASGEGTLIAGDWFWTNPTNSGNDYFRPMCTFASTNATSCSAVNGAHLNGNGSEPNNEDCDSCEIGDCSDGEDCGIFDADGTWNDSSCSNTLGFICETS